MSQSTTAVTADPKNEQAEPASGLTFFVRGLDRFYTEEADYNEIRQLFEELLGYRWESFDYWSTYWSFADPDDEAEKLEKKLEESSSKCDVLYLVGHSYGALLLRKAILLAAAKKSRWLKKVDRVILLGGTNRGFQPYSRWTEKMAIVGNILQLLPKWLGWLRFGRLAILGLRGSPWVTKLRMEWVEKARLGNSALPFTIQIRASEDKLVGRNDSRDIAVSGNSESFVALGLGHKDLALLPRGKVDPTSSDQDQQNQTRLSPAEIKERLKKQIKAALKLEKPSADSPRKADSHSIPKHVIFLIHGIRDFAEWHEDVGETITLSAKTDPVEIVSISYGYFSALQFLLPTARARCAHSFRDRYVQYFARYAGAKFSALAHSNGTYALAHALKTNSYMKLDRVLLAGSVLPREWPWAKMSNQVGKLRNDCANADWPVGALCWALHLIYPKQLGTAGLNGFKGNVPFVRNNFLIGDHSAALEPRYHGEIAEFLLYGEPWKAAADLTTWGGRLWRGLLRFLLLVPVLLTLLTFYYIPDGVRLLQHYMPALLAIPDPWASMVLAVFFVVLMVLMLLLA